MNARNDWYVCVCARAGGSRVTRDATVFSDGGYYIVTMRTHVRRWDETGSGVIGINARVNFRATTDATERRAL